MAEPPATRVTLLARIRDGHDADAWGEFVRLQDADAADLMQDVMRSVARNAGKLEYDPARGTFRGWLYTITRNKIYNFLSAQRNRPRASGDPDAKEQLDAAPAREEGGPDADWEKEYQRRLTDRAMQLVEGEFQPATWKAFWQTAVDGQPAAEVGAGLGMSPGAVYVAKSRVLARLREEVRRMIDEEDNQ